MQTQWMQCNKCNVKMQGSECNLMNAMKWNECNVMNAM